MKREEEDLYDYDDEHNVEDQDAPDEITEK